MNETPQTPSPPPPVSGPPPVVSVAPAPQGASGRAIASLIIGIVAFFLYCCCCVLGLGGSATAFLLGWFEEKAINRGEAPAAGRTLAKVGWILGLIGLILGILYIVFYVIYFGFTLSAIDWTKVKEEILKNRQIHP